MDFDQYHEPPQELSEETRDLEFLMRRTPVLRDILKNVLFKKGDLIELAENAEETIHED